MDWEMLEAAALAMLKCMKVESQEEGERVFLACLNHLVEGVWMDERMAATC